MLLNFEGKACIVTGASRGIGKAIAEALLQRKARVLLVDVLYKVMSLIIIIKNVIDLGVTVREMSRFVKKCPDLSKNCPKAPFDQSFAPPSSLLTFL